VKAKNAAFSDAQKELVSIMVLAKNQQVCLILGFNLITF